MGRESDIQPQGIGHPDVVTERQDWAQQAALLAHGVRFAVGPRDRRPQLRMETPFVP